MESQIIEETPNTYQIKGDEVKTVAEPAEVKKKVVFGLPGDNFSSKFLLSWTATINALWERYRDWVKEQADDSLKLLSRADFDKQIIEIVGMPVKNGGWKGLVFKIVNPQAVESDDEGKGNLDI